MKEHSIVMTDEEVRATLEGRKTIMRRVIRPQPGNKGIFQVVGEKTGDWFGQNPNYPRKLPMFSGPWCCPFGQVGDHLWVKEPWWHYLSDELEQAGFVGGTIERNSRRYNANTEFDPNDYGIWRERPSIRMPRWASRLALEVTAVRVERLQDIDDGDAQYEGCEPDDAALERDVIDFIPSFCRLWDSINAKRGFGWDVNPWVWVVEYRRIEV